MQSNLKFQKSLNNDLPKCILVLSVSITHYLVHICLPAANTRGLDKYFIQFWQPPLITAPCEPGWKYFDETKACFQFESTNYTASGAISNCQSMDAEVASIACAGELSFIQGEMKSFISKCHCFLFLTTILSLTLFRTHLFKKEMFSRMITLRSEPTSLWLMTWFRSNGTTKTEQPLSLHGQKESLALLAATSGTRKIVPLSPLMECMISSAQRKRGPFARRNPDWVSIFSILFC